MHPGHSQEHAVPAYRLAAVLAAVALTGTALAVQADAQPPRGVTPRADVDGSHIDRTHVDRATAFTVTAELKPTSVLRNERTVLSGTVKPVRTSTRVLIQRRGDDGWRKVAKRTLKDDGSYRFAFKTNSAGTYTYRAKMPKVGDVQSGKSPEVELTVAEEALWVFKIKDGTSASDWNTEATTVEAQVGDTLRIVNNDMMAHRPHTDGDPFPNPSKSIPAGGSADYELTTAYDSNDEHTLYCAIHGPSSQFWIDVVEP
jgi:plastocyanin